MSFAFEGSLYLIGIGAFCSALLTGFLYFRSRIFSTVNKGVFYLLAFLRFTVIFTLFFLLAKPVLKYTLERLENPLLIVLIDNSESIRLAKIDTAEIKDVVNRFKQKIGSDLNFKVYGFDENLIPENQIQFSGSKTNLHQAFQQVNLRHQQQNLAGVVLLSDGIINQGQQSAELPFFASPIFTLALGDSSVKKDLMIKEVYHNEVVFKGSSFPVKTAFFSSGFAGKKVSLQLFVDDSLQAEKNLLVTKDQFYIEWDVSLKTEKLGLHQLRVELAPVANELTLANNSKTSFFEVKAKKYNILILYDAPHPDIGALQSCFVGVEEYDIQRLKFSEFNGDFKGVDLVVIHDRPDENNKILLLKKTLKEQSIPCLLFNPPSAVLGKTTLLREPSVKRNLQNQAQISLNEKFTLFPFSEEFKRQINSWPPINSPYYQESISNGLEVFAFQKINQISSELPLISFQESAENRVVYIHGEGIWRWKMSEIKGSSSGEFFQFQGLMEKIVSFLLAQDKKQALELMVSKEVALGEDVEVTANFINDLGQASNFPDASLSLYENAQLINEYDLLKVNQHYQINLGALKQGTYHLKCSLKSGNKTHQCTKSFVVLKSSLESQNLTANHSFLRNISHLSGGEFYSFNKSDELFNNLLAKEYLQKTFFEYFSEGLIHQKWIFFLLLIMMSFEWAIRKWYGTI